MSLSKSDRHKLIEPRVAGLVLAALRLGLHVSKSDVTMDLVWSKWENKARATEAANSDRPLSSPTNKESNA